MIEVIDKETNMRCMQSFSNPNNYMITMGGLSKAVVEILEQGQDVLGNYRREPSCTYQELFKIIEKFNEYFYSKNPEVNGILYESRLNPYLEQIGFRELSENSKFLYQSNNKVLKDGKGEK